MDLDEFSDDGLDDLTENAFKELERQAIQFTQAHTQAPRPWPSQDAQQTGSGGETYGWEEEDDDLDTAEVIHDGGLPVVRPVVDKTLRQNHQQHQQDLSQQPLQQQRRPIPPIPNPQWNPTIDPSNRPNPALAARARYPHPSGPHHQPFSASQRLPPTSQGFGPPQATPYTTAANLTVNRFPPTQAAPSQPGDITSALQQRVRALENELNAARGEASIIRSKFTKAQQEHDAQVSRLKKLNSEQISKQERLVDAAVAAERSANTELQFMQRDMREANDRARRRDAGNTVGPVTTTPKKQSKTWGIADGFDEMEIVASPTKGQGRGKNAGSVASNVGDRTPSKGKRKRPVVDSPVKALETHTSDVVMGEDRPESSQPAVEQRLITAPAAPFEFLHLVLDHGCFHQQPPTFDTLSRFAFPSDATGTSFAATIFENLPTMGNPHRPMQLLVDFSGLIISMWDRCFQEQFWEPIKYLVALITFTFQLHTISVAPHIVNALVPTAQSTIFPLAKARLRTSDGSISNNPELGALEEHIDTLQILSLLYASALACATTPSETERGIEYTSIGFWRLASLEFVLLLLTPKQHAEDVIVMLELLASSPLPESIGPVEQDKDAAFVARAVIERVSAKLTETLPQSSSTPSNRRKLRLAALKTLIAFSRYPFGATQLAAHDNALPRLVTCLSGSIDSLYNQSIPSSILPPLPDDIASALKLPESTASTELYSIIAQCVMLIHTLVTDPQTANTAEIGQKLSLAHGGSQRYLIALGRLAFAEEDLVIEAGIDGEVVEAAHELLEMAVTPDEGEILSEAFGA